MKKLLKILGAILLIVVLVVVALVGYLTIDEYKPEATEKTPISGQCDATIHTGIEYTFMTWNVGYGALGDNADFFMDGGKMVYSADKERVRTNLSDISKIINTENPDFIFFQELDRNSSRSYYTDELETILGALNGDSLNRQSTFASNFNVAFVPLPVPPIGRVYAGLATVSGYEVSDAERVALPCPFSWPLRTFNLKRCLLVTRHPVEGSDKELVLINLHLEAYDSGEGKIAQTNMLKDIMNSEADKGNYVIVAGDFNQTFSNIDISKYPVHEGRWEAGTINVEDFGDRFTFCYDDTNPTCRSLDRAYADADKDPQNFQYYMLDGYIVSNNVSVNGVQTVDTGFKCSDHNPVTMKFVLKSE